MMGETENTTGVTTGELSRAVGLIRGDIKDVKKDISEKPSASDLEAVRREAKAEAGGLRQRIVDLENWQTWALRLGVPGLIMAGLNAVNTFGGAVTK